MKNTKYEILTIYECEWKSRQKNLDTPLYKENRIHIRVEFKRKKCKTAILLYCFHTAGVLHIFMLYNLLGRGTSFYRKFKINIRKPNYYSIKGHLKLQSL